MHCAESLVAVGKSGTAGSWIERRLACERIEDDGELDVSAAMEVLGGRYGRRWDVTRWRKKKEERGRNLLPESEGNWPWLRGSKMDLCMAFGQGAWLVMLKIWLCQYEEARDAARHRPVGGVDAG